MDTAQNTVALQKLTNSTNLASDMISHFRTLKYFGPSPFLPHWPANLTELILKQNFDDYKTINSFKSYLSKQKTG